MPLSRCPLNVAIYYPLLSTRSRSRILSPTSSLRCHLPHAPSTLHPRTRTIPNCSGFSLPTASSRSSNHLPNPPRHPLSLPYPVLPCSAVFCPALASSFPVCPGPPFLLRLQTPIPSGVLCEGGLPKANVLLHSFCIPGARFFSLDPHATIWAVGRKPSATDTLTRCHVAHQEAFSNTDHLLPE